MTGLSINDGISVKSVEWGGTFWNFVGKKIVACRKLKVVDHV